MRTFIRTTGLICLVLWLTGCSDPDIVTQTHISTPPVKAVTADVKAATAEVERFPLRTALFGDLHVHTSWSADAYAGGNRLGPNSAYRFAKGEKVELQTGAEAQLQVPLDFVALTDHAEGFEALPCTMMPDSPEFDLQVCRDLRSGDLDKTTMLKQAFEMAGVRPQPHAYDICGDDKRCQTNALATWQRVQALSLIHI